MLEIKLLSKVEGVGFEARTFKVSRKGLSKKIYIRCDHSKKDNFTGTVNGTFIGLFLTKQACLRNTFLYGLKNLSKQQGVSM